MQHQRQISNLFFPACGCRTETLGGCRPTHTNRRTQRMVFYSEVENKSKNCRFFCGFVLLKDGLMKLLSHCVSGYDPGRVVWTFIIIVHAVGWIIGCVIAKSVHSQFHHCVSPLSLDLKEESLKVLNPTCRTVFHIIDTSMWRRVEDDPHFCRFDNFLIR